MRRELVSCAGEWAGPRLGMIVHNTVWIQDAATALALDRLILEGARVVFTLLQWRVPVGSSGQLAQQPVCRR